jgi:hypothetical protein
MLLPVTEPENTDAESEEVTTKSSSSNPTNITASSFLQKLVSNMAHLSTTQPSSFNSIASLMTL